MPAFLQVPIREYAIAARYAEASLPQKSQFLLPKANQKDERLKEEYAKAEGDLRDYHKGLSCFE